MKTLATQVFNRQPSSQGVVQKPHNARSYEKLGAGPYLASGIESIMEVWRPISRCGRRGCENLPEKESHPQITRARLRRTREQISD